MGFRLDSKKMKSKRKLTTQSSQEEQITRNYNRTRWIKCYKTKTRSRINTDENNQGAQEPKIPKKKS